jgi:tetratricopeptide (TPR) repeat protein
VDYAVARIKLGDVLGNPSFSNQERPAEALTQYEQAQTILGRLYAGDSSATNVMRLYGLIYERIGTIHNVEDRQDAALNAFRRSSDLRERYAEAHPANTDAVRDWAVAHEKMGHMHLQVGDLDKAQSRYRQSLDIFRTLAEADPHNAQAKQSLAISHMHMGDLFAHPTRPSLGDVSAATTHFRIARDLLDTVCQIDSTNAHARTILTRVQDRLEDLAADAPPPAPTS